MKYIPLIIVAVFCTSFSYAQQNGSYKLSSPDQKIVLSCNPADATYSISFEGHTVLKNSRLGLIRSDGDFSKGLTLIRASSAKRIEDSYTMLNAKKKNISYVANELTVETKNAAGQKMDMIFRASNDGLAFRYQFPEKDNTLKKISAESTTFSFPEGTKAWLQPKTEAQTGFEHTNPSYEAHYKMDIPAGTSSPGQNGWVYPALFKTGDTWVMLTEADLGRNYCGTALQQFSSGGEYKINFPQEAEKIPGGALYPESALPWKTPWRIIAIGKLKTVMESTLGTDLAVAAKEADHSYIKPGKSSWSWVLEKDGATIYSVQKKYIDYAADMNWQYCLIDANWDQSIGYDSVAMLANYARQKNVGLLLWYNSAGNWNTVKFTPRDKMLSKESRMAEFGRLQKMNIKGVKIDFFGGDGQSMINYYQDILEDAAKFNILVNFHGATLPRGWQRTYPNLMTAEAILGYEMITFGQETADKAPEHMVMSAMVRNAFDPMDFTPMALYQIPKIKRATTAAFELATAVTFLSGIQHYAETPDGMSHVPDYVKDFLRTLPGSWDDVRFIDGFPGKHFVVARKTGSKWYIAGINGEKLGKSLKLDLPFLKNKTGRMIASGSKEEGDHTFLTKEVVVSGTGSLEVKLKMNDGFVAVFD